MEWFPPSDTGLSFISVSKIMNGKWRVRVLDSVLSRCDLGGFSLVHFAN